MFMVCEKSPCRCRSVGMVRIVLVGSWLRHPSYAVNVNSRFLITGLPPESPQMWLRTRLGVLLTELVRAFSAGLRPK